MTEALIGAVATLLGALITVLVSHLLGRRRVSDRQVLELWRAAFDRAAFKGPYKWHSDQERFREAIALTTQCVNTGVLQNRRGTVLGTSKPKAQIARPAWRAVGDDLERRLKRIQNLIPESGPPRDPEAMDRERNEIIDVLNGLFKSAGLPLLPTPTEAATLDDVFHE